MQKTNVSPFKLTNYKSFTNGCFLSLSKDSMGRKNINPKKFAYDQAYREMYQRDGYAEKMYRAFTDEPV